MTTATMDDVINLVKECLDQHQPTGFRLRVIKEGSKQEDDWWYILVQPDDEGVSAFEYAHNLAKAEEEIEKRATMNILLVPVLPD